MPDGPNGLHPKPSADREVVYNRILTKNDRHDIVNRMTQLRDSIEQEHGETGDNLAESDWPSTELPDFIFRQSVLKSFARRARSEPRSYLSANQAAVRHRSSPKPSQEATRRYPSL